MAKQAGPFYFIGTIDDLTFYKMGDQYYVKSKSECSEATKKKYKTDPGYALLRLKRNSFGQASTLVREIYYTHLPRAVRKHGLFGKLTGMANVWLLKGNTKEDVLQLLKAHCKKLAAAGSTLAPKETNKEIKVPEALNLELQNNKDIKENKRIQRTLKNKSGKKKGSGLWVAWINTERIVATTSRKLKGKRFQPLKERPVPR